MVMINKMNAPGWSTVSRKAAFIILMLCFTCITKAFHIHSQFKRPTSRSLSASLIVGVNKYSHDASICIVDSTSGAILFTQAKERITGRKHDGGAVGELVDYGLEYLKASRDDISAVVSNNHHFRVHPFEKRIPFASALNYIPNDYTHISNLLPHATHYELSHHLAHAWGCVATAPFTSGIVLVMDGMGESYSAMVQDLVSTTEPPPSSTFASTVGSGDYMHDLRLLRAYESKDFVGQPYSLAVGSSYREAETAYFFDTQQAILRPVFKRWTRERSPAECYNHGFENMESMGAVYSRISSQILGDWNACGKIMGLGPWAGRSKAEASQWGYGSSGKGSADHLGLGVEFHHATPLMRGNPYDGTFEINWAKLEQLGGESSGSHAGPNKWSDSKFGEHATLAQSVQSDLEGCAMSLVASLRGAHPTAGNLCLTGGVALNSVLNGRISRESGFQQVFIPPCPGDEGIAVGCAIYGLQRHREKAAFETSSRDNGAAPSPPPVVPIMQSPLPAYQGKSFSEEEVEAALDEHSPFITSRYLASADEIISTSSSLLAEGKVLAWFHGRSEVGQRSLGARSILADPRSSTVRSHINSHVKGREWWRPLAPSVLAEHAREWFDGLSPSTAGSSSTLSDASPYMQLTATCHPDKAKLIPAVLHVDQTARLQTVSPSVNSLFHALIAAFFQLTGIPMLLNTSFNQNSQPIVESPEGAINTFLQTKGGIDYLVIGAGDDGAWLVERRPCPLLLSGEKGVDGPAVIESSEAAHIMVTGLSYYLSETTASTSTSSPLRVRIQAGVTGSVYPGPASGGEDWITLPTAQHLELLQVLQPLASSGEGGGYGYTSPEEEEGVFVLDLFEAMVSSREEGAIAASSSEWHTLAKALVWLYDNQLVSFGGGAEEGLDSLVESSDMMDLRPLG